MADSNKPSTSKGGLGPAWSDEKKQELDQAVAALDGAKPEEDQNQAPAADDGFDDLLEQGDGAAQPAPKDDDANQDAGITGGGETSIQEEIAKSANQGVESPLAEAAKEEIDEARENQEAALNQNKAKPAEAEAEPEEEILPLPPEDVSARAAALRASPLGEALLAGIMGEILEDKGIRNDKIAAIAYGALFSVMDAVQPLEGGKHGFQTTSPRGMGIQFVAGPTNKIRAERSKDFGLDEAKTIVALALASGWEDLKLHGSKQQQALIREAVSQMNGELLAAGLKGLTINGAAVAAPGQTQTQAQTQTQQVAPEAAQPAAVQPQEAAPQPRKPGEPFTTPGGMKVTYSPEARAALDAAGPTGKYGDSAVKNRIIYHSGQIGGAVKSAAQKLGGAVKGQASKFAAGRKGGETAPVETKPEAAAPAQPQQQKPRIEIYGVEEAVASGDKNGRVTIVTRPPASETPETTRETTTAADAATRKTDPLTAPIDPKALAKETTPIGDSVKVDALNGPVDPKALARETTPIADSIFGATPKADPRQKTGPTPKRPKNRTPEEKAATDARAREAMARARKNKSNGPGGNV